MPGFIVNGMGVDGQPSNTIEPRRKYRWIFELIGRGSGSFSRQELLVLQKANRPKIQYDNITMHHNQELANFAGKTKWSDIELTWYDIEQDPDVSLGIYKWIQTVTNLRTANAAHPKNYKKLSQLSMLNGNGQPTETWRLFGTYPEESDWGPLDYTESQIAMISVKMKYDRAMRNCDLLPGQAIPAPFDNCESFPNIADANLIG